MIRHFRNCAEWLSYAQDNGLLVLPHGDQLVIECIKPVDGRTSGLPHGQFNETTNEGFVADCFHEFMYQCEVRPRQEPL